MLIPIIIILAFSSILILFCVITPPIIEIIHKINEKKVARAQRELDKMYIDVQGRNLLVIYTIGPFIAGIVGLLIFKNLIAAFILGLVTFTLPTLIIKRMDARRKNRFANQLIDGITILTSSLKAGLSLLQAIEVLTEELPAPISQEFGLILRENKVGIPLEDSFSRLNKRMNLEELVLLTNAIFVARETGGDLTKVLSKLSNTIRDNRKLKERIKTLTLQGKIQAWVMSVLPFFFVAWAVGFNRNHFDIFFSTDQGRMLFITAIILQIAGIVLIRRFSRINI